MSFLSLEQVYGQVKTGVTDWISTLGCESS
jgi:hypothetical protein